MNWEAEHFINLWPLNSKSILCLLCDKRDGHVNIFFLPPDTMLSLVSRGLLEGHWRSKGFLFLHAVCELSPVLSVVVPPAPCSCRMWQPAGPGSQQLPWVPPGDFIEECCWWGIIPQRPIQKLSCKSWSIVPHYDWLIAASQKAGFQHGTAGISATSPPSNEPCHVLFGKVWISAQRENLCGCSILAPRDSGYSLCFLLLYSELSLTVARQFSPFFPQSHINTSLY